MMKKRGHRLLISLMVGAAVMLTGCGSKEAGETSGKETASESSDSKEPEEKQPAFGTFESETLSGEAIDQSVFQKADLTMVNVWGTFCSICINEMPELGKLNRELADQGFQVVGMISNVNKPGDSTAREIVDATKADYTHIISSSDLRSGLLGRIQAVPTTIFVDKNGVQVGDVYSGARNKTQWESIIKKLLEEV